MTYTVENVNDWFQAVQFRDADPVSVQTWVVALNYGLFTPDTMQESIVNDAFTAGFVNPVIRLYQAAFGRIPDQAGQNFWVDDLAAGRVTIQDVANAFANSQEFKESYGTSNANSPISAAVLTAFYKNVLQRDPDSAGYAYWLSSGLNVAQVLNYFANSSEFILSTNALIDLYQFSQLNHTLPEESVSLWYFLPPEPIPEPETEPDPGPDPITFTVTNSSGSLSFGGTATGDVTFTVASDGTATFTRGGVTASSTYAISSIAASPLVIKLSADIASIALADAFVMVNIYNYDENSHTYTLSNALGSLGAMTVEEADVVENAVNAASYTYTIADYISNADGLNFTTAYTHNVGIALTGSAGNQTVIASGYDDILTGGADNDTMTGGAGNDTFNADDGSDTITDLSAGDTLNVTSGAWVHVSLFDLTTATVNNSGNIIIEGTGVADSITGSTGGDLIYAGLGNDTMTGSGGNDQLDGGGGSDVYRYGSSGDTASTTVTYAGGYATFTIPSDMDYIDGDINDIIDLAGTSGWQLTSSAVLPNNGSVIDRNFYATTSLNAMVISDSGQYYLVYETTAGVNGTFGNMEIVKLSGSTSIFDQAPFFQVSTTGEVSFY